MTTFADIHTMTMGEQSALFELIAVMLKRSHQSQQRVLEVAKSSGFTATEVRKCIAHMIGTGLITRTVTDHPSFPHVVLTACDDAQVSDFVEGLV